MKLVHIRKVGKNKYEIDLENHEKVKTYDTIILKYQLLLKKELSDELFEKIKEETKLAEVYEKALQFLNRKLRSEKEVKEFLRKQDIIESDQSSILERLKQQGLFHEDTYIEAYVHDRIAFSNEGPNKIRKSLLDQGFDPEKVEKSIEKIDQMEIEEKLGKLIQKKMNSNHKYSEQYCKQKVLESMQQLGYSKYMVEAILEEFNVNHSDILEKEARKLYQKYKLKKSGKELFLVLKQKLYQKQYPIDEINAVLEHIIE